MNDSFQVFEAFPAGERQIHQHGEGVGSVPTPATERPLTVFEIYQDAEANARECQAHADMSGYPGGGVYYQVRQRGTILFSTQ